MKIELCSLFSGIGAFEKSMTNLGVDFEITSYCEIEKHSACAYAAIHGVSESLNLGDISKVKSEDIPYFNLLTWGFPCQDISIAGNQAGIKVGTRSGLYYEGYRILKDRLPKYSIIENVKNLTQKGHADEFAMILNDLESLGYKNYWKVLNAKDFGVPQNRERVFIVSILGEGDFEMPVGKDSGIRLKDILESEVEEKYYIDKPFKLVNKKNVKAECYNEGFDQNRRVYGTDGYFQCLGAKDRGTNKILVKAWIDNNSTYKETNRILDESGVCTTLTTMKGGRREPKIIENKINRIDIDFPVRVRKYQVNIEALKQLLRKSKQASNMSIKDISNKLNIPLTNVEHWFRNDDCFSIPDEKIWFNLKELLNISTNDFDLPIMEFEEKQGVFEKSKRCYKSDGIAPTLTCMSGNEKIVNGFRIRKLTPLECWRLMGFSDEDFNKAKAALILKFYHGKDNANSQLYKMAGNSIVVTVLEAIIKNLLGER